MLSKTNILLAAWYDYCPFQIRVTLDSDTKMTRYEKSSEFEAFTTIIVNGDELVVVSLPFTRLHCYTNMTYGQCNFRAEGISNTLIAQRLTKIAQVDISIGSHLNFF